MFWIILVIVVAIVLIAVGLVDHRRRRRAGPDDLVRDPRRHDSHQGAENNPLNQLGQQGWVPMPKDDPHPHDDDRS